MENKPQTYIFIGQSGCGKGTQAKLLEEWIKQNDVEKREVFHLETGAKFREFFTTDSFTSKRATALGATGARQPDFLAIHIWSHVLIESYNGNQHLLIDGTPRSLAETTAFDSAMKFYDREKPTVIFINVSKQWSIDRLTARGRGDDKSQEEIEKRLAWFTKDVMPAVEWYRGHPEYHFVELNGEQSIEAVHAELISKIEMK